MAYIVILLLYIVGADLSPCLRAIAMSTMKNPQSILVIDSLSKENTPEQTVISFLKWYRDNENRVKQHILVKGGLTDTTTFYSIDYKGTEAYLAELKKSKFLSNTFLKNLREYFIECDRKLKEHPLNDGPPWGFEADLIMKCQDYMDVWVYINKAKVIKKKINGNKARIILHFVANYKMDFTLTRIKNKWLIDSIDNVFN